MKLPKDDPFKQVWSAFDKKEWDQRKDAYDERYQEWQDNAKDWYRITEERQAVPSPWEQYPQQDKEHDGKMQELFSDREKKILFNRFIKVVEKLKNTGDLNKFLLKFAELAVRASSFGVNINKWVKELLPPDKLRDFVMMGAFGRVKKEDNV